MNKMSCFADRSTSTDGKKLIEKQIYSNLKTKKPNDCDIFLTLMGATDGIERQIRNPNSLGFNDKQIHVVEREQKTFNALKTELNSQYPLVNIYNDDFLNIYKKLPKNISVFVDFDGTSLYKDQVLN